MWGLVPWPGMELGPLCWELGVLVTGLPGKSQGTIPTDYKNVIEKDTPDLQQI